VRRGCRAPPFSEIRTKPSGPLPEKG
jgi:hypothetical protein